MKYRILTFAIILAMILAGLGQVKPVSATGWGTKFVTAITYQNVGGGTSTVQIDFYPAGSGTPLTYNPPDIAASAGNTVVISGLNLTGFSQGSAIMSSSQPLVATLVQLPQLPSTVKNRPLSSGFSGGAPSVMLATVLKAFFNTNSIFTVQNVDTDPADITITFTALTGTNFTKTIDALPVGSSQYFDMSTISDGGATWNGSAKIVAVKDGTTTPGAVVATSLELATNSDNAYAFEGVANSAGTIYMPSSACDYLIGGVKVNSNYAIQNTDAAAVANVTITYKTPKGGVVETHVDSFTVDPGKKVSKGGCGAAGDPNPPNSLGSATIVATGAQIVAIGKISGAGLSTAYVGVSQGASKYALPYVRYTDAHWFDGKQQRGNIAIQNIGGAIGANLVTVKYFDKNGLLVGTHTLGAFDAGAKLNSNPKMATPTPGCATCAAVLPEFGYNPQTGGAVIVEGPGGSQLAVVVRISTYVNATTTVGEDYNGVPIQ